MSKHSSSVLVVLLAASLLLLGACVDPETRLKSYYESGQQYLDQGRPQEAIIQFRNALQISGGHLPSKLALARAYQMIGDHANAVAEYRKILEEEEDNIEAKLNLGNYYLLSGARRTQDYEEAKKLAEEVLAQEPENVAARILLGNAYARLQNLDESVSELKTVLESDPSNLAAGLNLGALEFSRENVQEAEKIFLDTLQQHPDSSTALRAVGQFYAATGDLEKAESYFKKAVSTDPQDQIAVYSLIQFYLATDRAAEVPGVFEQAIAAAKDPLPLKVALSRFEFTQRNFDKVRQILDQILEDNPNQRDALLTLAELQISQEEYEPAAEIVDNVLKRYRADPQAHYLKGRLAQVEGDSEAALEEFNRALEGQPNFAAALLGKASVLLSQFKVDEAGVLVEEVLRLNPGNLGALGARAKILMLQGRPEGLAEAIRAAEAVLAVQPDNLDALTARGEANLRQRNLAAARADFERSAELAPENPFFLHRLGAIDILENNPRGAVEYFQRALAINPELADVQNDLLFLFLRDKKFNEALAEIRRLKVDKRDVPLILEGRVYLEQKEYDLAEARLKEALEANPENYQGYLLLGRLNLEKGRYQEAVAEVDQLLSRQPKFAPAYLLKAFYLDAQGDAEGAIANYRLALQLAPQKSDEHWVAANNLAWLLASSGDDLNEALTLARSARQARPDNPEYADTLGWVYYQLGSYTLAADQLLFAVNESPQPTAGHYYRLGMAYYKAGDALHAGQTLRKAVELSDSFEGVETARQVLSELQAARTQS